MDAHLAKTLIGKAPAQAANALKARLAEAGIEIALIHNTGNCSSGCGGMELEIWAHPTDVADITQLAEGAWRAQLAAMGYDATLADHVFDASAADATCPACGTTFATSHGECPECGLCFAVPGGDPGAAGGGCR